MTRHILPDFLIAKKAQSQHPRLWPAYILFQKSNTSPILPIACLRKPLFQA
ncbi:hypothetical protein Cal7507_1561 [Calothrix sp. PCC 7507]|nr:hypothetical protein Cal7507_1561 [Calothrix sp. PCC 7507]